VLYVNYGCPWAHRTIIVRALKGLEDVIELVEVDGMTEGKGWTFTGQSGPDKDPIYGFKYIRQLYEKADAAYEGRITVPVLWDKQKGKVGSLVIMCMLLNICRNHCQQRKQRNYSHAV
jgi:putative glutathione S-transferase